MRKSLFMENIANFQYRQYRRKEKGKREYQIIEQIEQIEQADILTEELIGSSISNARERALISIKMAGVSDYKIIIACLICKNTDYAKKYSLRSWDTKFIKRWFKGVEPLLLGSKSPSEYGSAVVNLSRQLHRLIILRRMAKAGKEIKKEIIKEIEETQRCYVPIAKKFKVLGDELMIMINQLKYYLM